MPFEPGQSGNPTGRPKLPDEIGELRKLAAAELWGGLSQAVTGKAVEGISVHAAEVGAKIVEQAKEGSGYHQKLILDRFLGQAPQSIELNAQVYNKAEDPEFKARLEKYQRMLEGKD